MTANPDNLNLIWRQLQARADQLFLVDLATLQVRVSYPDNSQSNANRLTRQNIEWLRAIKGPEMSSFKESEQTNSATNERERWVSPHCRARPYGADRAESGPGFGGPGGSGGGEAGGGGGAGGGPPGAFGGGPGGPGGFNPGGPNGGPGGPGDLPPQRELSTTQPAQFAVVVVVPIDKIRDQFFKFLDSDTSHDTGRAILVNEQGETLLVGDEDAQGNVAPWPGMGTQLLKQLDPETSACSLEPLITDPSRAHRCRSCWINHSPSARLNPSRKSSPPPSSASLPITIGPS